MAKPKIAAGMPIAVDLEPGSYWWCACGRSKEQPFCDGSHSGTEFEPLEFAVTEKKRFVLCQCKRTKNPPYCDGAHRMLKVEE
ncbi:MAG: CDGSH iron-sulfur domain-containing protein [Candidatus Zixiibacteriota bacterium]